MNTLMEILDEFEKKNISSLVRFEIQIGKTRLNFWIFKSECILYLFTLHDLLVLTLLILNYREKQLKSFVFFRKNKLL